MPDSGTMERGLSQMSKTILASVVASLIVAAVINGFTFVATMSKMGTVLENVQSRVAILEQRYQIMKDLQKKVEIDIARSNTILELIRNDLSVLHSDVRQFHFNGRSAREAINQ